MDETTFENLERYLGEIDKEGKEIILMGDTNCDFKNNTNANTKRLNCIYSEYQLEQLINSYTRVAVTTNELNETQMADTFQEIF